MTQVRFEFTIKFSADKDPVRGWGHKIEDFIALATKEFDYNRFENLNPYNKKFEVIDQKEIKPREESIFFVLHGWLNGEDGVGAVTCDGKQLEDGWYYLPEGYDDPPANIPYRSREEASKGLQDWKHDYEYAMENVR